MMHRLAFASLLFLSCVPAGPSGPGGTTVSRGGLVVLLPVLVSEEGRTPLRSVLAWPGEEVLIRLPEPNHNLTLRVSPGRNSLSVEDVLSGRSYSAPPGSPITIPVGTARVEISTEFP